MCSNSLDCYSFEICAYSNADGVALKNTSSTTWKSALIDVSEFTGKEITVTTYNTKNTPCFAVDSELHILDTYSTTSGNSTIPKIYTIPITNETKYIIIHTYNNDNLIPTIDGLDVDLTTVVCKAEQRIDETENELENVKGALKEVETDAGKNTDAISEIKQTIYTEDVSIEYTEGCYVNNNGVAVLDTSSPVWHCVVFDVSKSTNKTLSVVTYASTSKPIYFVDANFNIVETIRDGLTNNTNIKYQTTITIPENATTLIIHHYVGRPDVELTGYKTVKYISLEKVVQEQGDSDTSIMSQKAVTDCITQLNKEVKKIPYSFRKIDTACDSYSNETDTITLPKDDNNRYIDPVNNVYALYDGLVESYPGYVTKTLMGTVLPETEVLPIYRYDFVPPMLLGSKTDDVCKILYCSGIHGGEVAPILQGFRFFKDLCENWRNQELLRTLRFNVHFTVIPIVNPYGIQHNQKTNENGVNLNRNFTNGWVYDAGDGTSASSYSGETPASELATQLIENMIANERFEFGIDHHTFSNFVTAGYVGYFVSNDVARPQDKSFADLVGTWISSKVVTNNTLITDLSKSYFRTTAGNLFKGYLYGAFPSGYCFESVFAWGDEQMEALYECQKFGAEILGGIFHSALVGYHTY